MWFMQKENLEAKIRDLEAVHGILVNLRAMNVVKDDKELDNWIRPVEEQILNRVVQSTMKLHYSRRKWFK